MNESTEHLKIDILKNQIVVKTTKLRLAAKEETNKIEGLKEELKNNEYKLLNAETKIFKLLTNLKYEEEGILNDIRESELKLEKLGLSE